MLFLAVKAVGSSKAVLVGSSKAAAAAESDCLYSPRDCRHRTPLLPDGGFFGGSSRCQNVVLAEDC